MLVVAVIALIVSVAAVVVTFAFGKKQSDATVRAADAAVASTGAAIRSANTAEAARRDSEALWKRDNAIRIVAHLVFTTSQMTTFLVTFQPIGATGVSDAMANINQDLTQLRLVLGVEHTISAAATRLLHDCISATSARPPIPQEAIDSIGVAQATLEKSTHDYYLARESQPTHPTTPTREQSPSDPGNGDR